MITKTGRTSAQRQQGSSVEPNHSDEEEGEDAVSEEFLAICTAAAK
jgi:hypothetical protein